MGQDLRLYDQHALLEQIARGDVAAFRQLFDAYNKRLYAAALKLTKSPQVAEDIVQEVFMSLWKNRAQLSTVENPSAYIFTIAYNQTYRFLKKLAAKGRLYQSYAKLFKEATCSIEEELDVKETQRIIDQLVEQLPSKRRLIFRLSREKGLTHQEIAERLAISPLTVKKQIVLALRDIRSGLPYLSPVVAVFLFLIK